MYLEECLIKFIKDMSRIYATEMFKYMLILVNLPALVLKNL